MSLNHNEINVHFASSDVVISLANIHQHFRDMETSRVYDAEVGGYNRLVKGTACCSWKRTKRASPRLLR